MFTKRHIKKKPIGVSFEIGCYKKNNKRKWFVYIGKQKPLHIRPTVNNTNADYGGFKLDLSIGKLRRPVPKFYKKEFWSKDYYTKEQNTNPWNSGNHWFVLSIPCAPSFFLSICYGPGKNQPGFYVGCKTYEVNATSQGLGLYNYGNPEQILHKHRYPTFVAWGKSWEKGSIYLCPSASIRKDLVDG